MCNKRHSEHKRLFSCILHRFDTFKQVIFTLIEKEFQLAFKLNSFNVSGASNVNPNYIAIF